MPNETKNLSGVLWISGVTSGNLPFCTHRLCTLPHRSGRMFTLSVTETGGVYLLGLKTLASQTAGCCCTLLCVS